MNALETILDGLAEELELELELGVRTVEIDPEVLAPVSPVAPAAEIAQVPRPPSSLPPAPSPAPEPSRVFSAPSYDFIFLHHAPLSPAGVEMLSKIVIAMGRTAGTAPLFIAPPLPRAKIHVVLGSLALRKFYPAQTGGEPSAALLAVKRRMWGDLKSILIKLNGFNGQKKKGIES